MNLWVAAGLLAAFSALLLGPVSKWLSHARWIHGSPRAGVLLWQCVGLGALLAGIGAGLAMAVSRYHAGLWGGLVVLMRNISGGKPVQALGVYNALGLTLAADLLIVLWVCFGVVTFRTVRTRARHRRLLDLVTYETPTYPGTDFLHDPRALAYCLPGLRPRIVLSDGTRGLLTPDELWAVIHHERGHAHERHGLVLLPMAGVSNVFRWVPYARLAVPSICLLLEMAADDYSSRRSSPRALARALVEMATTDRAPLCAFAASGVGVLERVTHLLDGDQASKRSAVLAASLAVGAIAIPAFAAVWI